MSKQYKVKCKNCIIFTTASSQKEANETAKIFMGKNVK